MMNGQFINAYVTTTLTCEDFNSYKVGRTTRPQDFFIQNSGTLLKTYMHSGIIAASVAVIQSWTCLIIIP